MSCKGKGLYIHVPFCIKKCGYCDFFSLEGKPDVLKEKYTQRLVEEISQIRETVDTVFIGGGTPSSLPLQNLLDIIGACPIVKDGEFTVEVNPGTVDEAYLAAIRKAGVNRLSIGAQSLLDLELKVLGRIHTVNDFLTCYHAARRVGFDNINVDLMFAFPEQTEKSFAQTLEQMIALNPEHISCYALMIEEGTPFYQMGVSEAEQEIDRNLYHLAISMLCAAGYEQYEISNFAKAGMACRHNLNYWHAGEYYGCGAGAHAYCDGVRSFHPDCIESYLSCDDRVFEEKMLREDAMSEYAILMLRLTKGVDLSEFARRFDTDFKTVFKAPIAKWSNAGLLRMENGHCFLTDYGMDLANTVMCDFLL